MFFFCFQIGKLGLESGCNADRRFVVVDQKREFVSGRKYPKLVLVEAEVTETGQFKISAPGMDALTVALPDTELVEQETFQVRLRCAGNKIEIIVT